MSLVQQQYAELKQVVVSFERFLPQVEKLFPLFEQCFKNGHKVLTCGNGGSAADALHMAEELVGRYRGNRRSLPAISLSADVTALTCIGNDWGYDAVFSRQIEGLGHAGDILVIFSGSGNSANLIKALGAAKKLGIITVSLLGKGGGKARELSDHAIVIPTDNTARAQELHTWIMHVILEHIETVYPVVDNI
ncbi:MAG: SIS domain-containing protein [Verrucomicrobiales bacterium]|jgi:D-sedoheptulose 7-phosphate isomerase|nr:SIS domain-containing protein [Verrucomicrobiales bacterium]